MYWPQRRESSANRLLEVAAELCGTRASGKTLLFLWYLSFASLPGYPPAADIWQKAYLTSAWSRMLPVRSQPTVCAGVTNIN